MLKHYYHGSMLSKQPNLAGRLAFILLCFLDLGLVRTVPVLGRSAVSPQSDEFIESDKFILETYKNKLEEMDAKNLKSHAPTHKLLGTDSDKTSVSKVSKSNQDEIYLKELAQLKVENEALKKELAGLEQKTDLDLDNQNEEVITDNDLNYPVLPDTPKLLDSVIERKRGTWHTLDLDDDEPPKEQERLEQAGNPSFGHVGIGRTNLSPDAEKIISTDTVKKENVNEKSSNLNQDYPVFKAVATATGDDKIEVERGGDEKKTASTDVVTLTVAAIALLCAAVFIVFTAVQWRKTLKAIKIDQMKSNQSLKSMRNEIKKMTSMSSINIKEFEELVNKAIADDSSGPSGTTNSGSRHNISLSQDSSLSSLGTERVSVKSGIFSSHYRNDNVSEPSTGEVSKRTSARPAPPGIRKSSRGKKVRSSAIHRDPTERDELLEYEDDSD